MVLEDTIQLLIDFSCIELFPNKKLDDRSILDIRHFLEMKTNSSSNFSYEEKESIIGKLVYLNKNDLSKKMM